ncbi:NAD-dependent epimerase/dehydratase family protein [Paraburkholderia sp. BL25I1N1]|uniref:NAD-dependent epimerase/dehydratase family protein n=1 Tax=Paraburkholderia sp. BL25I1N1 TaxID=1938804 RepID=UPI000D06B921|nr:NAD-dependent epimerase/dehydratase family protein [Paraburkholderia sp. BL25I1N1]PRX91877.1 dTDP-L-rhamnose 4-epimerase [Paraburkholderia sp. BL25I1N1]
MKVLITGGAGFIGSSLARKLCANNAEVTVLDNLSPQIHGENPSVTSAIFASLPENVHFVKGSVTDRAMLERVMQGQDAIVHLAAETGTGQSMYEVDRYVDVNVHGTALILDILVKNSRNSVRKVVVASSRAIYGEGKYRSPAAGILYPGPRKEKDMLEGQFEHLCPISGEAMECVPTDEESKIHPTSLYGITKQTQEQMVMTTCRSIGIDASALRYQNVYGPGQSLSNPYTGILSIFSTRIKNGNPINIFEDGLESRDFVYIDDVVDATYAALTHANAADNVFGIGSGVRTSVMDVARTLCEVYASDVGVSVTGAFRLGDVRHVYADLTKARDMLGFEPKVSFSEGIARFAGWVDQQEVMADTYEKSIAEMREKGLYKGCERAA